MRISDWSSDVCSSDLVGGEDDGRALFGQTAHHPLQLALVERVEAGERLVEHHQPGLVDQRAENLHLLRHALGELADLAVCGIAEAVLQIGRASCRERVCQYV